MCSRCEVGTRGFSIWWRCGSYRHEAKWKVLHLTARGYRDIHVHVATDSRSQVQDLGLGSCGGKVLACLFLTDQFLSAEMFNINCKSAVATFLRFPYLYQVHSIQDWLFPADSLCRVSFSFGWWNNNKTVLQVDLNPEGYRSRQKDLERHDIAWSHPTL